MSESPPQPSASDKAARKEADERITFGLWMFLASLSVLFLSSLAGYLYVRTANENWVPENAPDLPDGIWISTLVLLASSGTLHWAYTAIKENRQAALSLGMLATTTLGILFLFAQLLNWLELLETAGPMGGTLHAFTFFFLTGLHALHVIGGIVPLVIVTIRAFRGGYSPAAYAGVKYCAIYWHFLLVMWVLLFATLLIAT